MSLSTMPRDTMFMSPNALTSRNRAGQKQKPGMNVVQSKGRGEVATPQAVIVLQAALPKNELDRRARMAPVGRAEALYAPPARSERDFDAKKGMVGLCLLNNQATFAGRIGNTNSVRVAVNMAGLSRSEKLGMPCVVQVARDALDANTDDRTTIIVQGVQTIVDTGSQPIACGEIVIIDPNPFLIADPVNKSGPQVSGINVQGVTENFMHPQTRTLTTNHEHALVQEFQNVLRARMGTSEFGKELAGCLAGVDPGARLAALFARSCTTLFDESNIAQDNPLRGLTLIWAPWYFLQMVNVESVRGIKPAALGMTTLACLHALHASLQQTEREFTRIYAQYDCALPHDTADERPVQYEASSNRASLFSDTLKADLDIDTLRTLTNDFERSRAMHRGEAHLNLHYEYHSKLLRLALKNYLFKFSLGIALCGAGRGAPVDVLLGGH